MTTAMVETNDRRRSLAARLGVSLVRSPSASILALLIGLVVFGGVKLSGDFLSVHNLNTILDAMVAPLLIGAIASVALLGGVVDLSMGVNVAVSAITFAAIYTITGSPWLAFAVTLAFGVAIGVLNAISVVLIGADPIVATLAMFAALGGVSLLFHGSNEYESAFVPGLYDFLSQRVLGIPILTLPIVAIFVVAELGMRFSRPGQHLRATGGAAIVARRAGIRTRTIQIGLYIGVSLSCSLGAVVFVGQTGAAAGTLGGGQFLLQVLGGALLGGFSLTHGGIGSPIGAMFGIFSLFVLSNIMDLTSTLGYWQMIITGSLIVAAIWLDGLRTGERFK